MESTQRRRFWFVCALAVTQSLLPNCAGSGASSVNEHGTRSTSSRQEIPAFSTDALVRVVVRLIGVFRGPPEQRKREVGTGFLVVKGGSSFFIVSTPHVAIEVSDPQLQIELAGDPNPHDTPLRLKIQDLTGDSQRVKWQLHPKQEIALLPLSPKTELVEKLRDRSLKFDYLAKHSENDLPNRDAELRLLGFPIIPPNPKTNVFYAMAVRAKRGGPLTTDFKVPRQNSTITPKFFLLDQPSKYGFSGGPVVELKVGESMKCVGVNYGTIEGFAAVAPAAYVAEMIASLP